jgi:hypothetical protein
MKVELSSADLLTIQVLQCELTVPSITIDYKREIKARILSLEKAQEESICLDS